MSALRKISIVVIACVAIWLVVPSTGFNGLLKGKPVKVAIESNTAIEPQQEEQELEKYQTPVYFSIFKFITGFLPGRN